MPRGNLYEDVVNEIDQWMERMSDEVATEVMGGKTPPWSKKLSSADKRQYWETRTPDERIGLLQEWGPEGYAKFQKEVGNGPG